MRKNIINTIIKIVLIAIAPVGLTIMLLAFADNSPVSPVTYLMICLAYIIFIFRKKTKNVSGAFSYIATGIFSLLFAFSLMLKKHIVYSGEIFGKLNVNYFVDVTFKDVLFAVLLSVMIFVLAIHIIDLIIILLGRLNEKVPKTHQLNGIKWSVLIFLGFVIVWGLGYLAFWPGTSMWNDIDAILVNGPIGESFRSPVFYNLITYFFLVVICNPVTDPNTGFAIYALCQLLFMAAVVTYVMWWAYAVVKIRTPLLVALFIFFAFYPMVGLYSFTVVKDVPFSLFMFLWLPVLYDAAREKKLCMRNKVLFCIAAVGTLIFRNNGKIILPLLVIVAFIFVKNNRKFIAAAGLSVLIVLTLISSLLTRNVPYRFAEGTGPLLQQIAMVLSKDGDVSEEDREFLYQIKEEEYWTGTDANSYVINDDFLNEHRAEFIMTYLRVLARNPSLCIEAWLMESYGFWAFGTWGVTQSYITGLNTTYYDYEMSPMLPGSLYETVQEYFMNSEVCYGSAGTFIWIILFIALLLILAKKSRYLIVLLPMIFNWLVILFLTPIAFGMRYVFYYFLIVPVVLALIPEIVEDKRMP